MRRRFSMVAALLVVVVQLCWASPAAAAPPSVVVRVGVLAPLAAVPIEVRDGPANLTDWVGVYLVGAPDWDYETWMYLGSGSHTVPAEPRTGILGWIEGPAAGGVYEVRFFANDGYSRLATSNTFTVTATVPRLEPHSFLVSAGGTVTVQVSGGPGNRTDWVGIVPSGQADTAYRDWKYLNDTKTAPATGSTSGTVTLTVPTTPGDVRIVLFLNNGFTMLTDRTITVIAPTIPTLRAGSTPSLGANIPVGPGARVTVYFNGTSGARRDWIGLYRDLDANSAFPPTTEFLDWRYLNDSKTAPTTGRTSGSVTFTMPMFEARYWVRLMADDGYVAVGEPDSISVGPPTDVTPSLTQVTAGEPITAYLAGGMGDPTDWVGLFPVSAPDTAYADWMYFNGTKTPPAVAAYVSTAARFLAPTTPGSYQFRVFASDGFTRLATSSVFTVT